MPFRKIFHSCLRFVLAISLVLCITLTNATPALAFHSEEHQDVTRKALIGKVHPEIVLSLINVSTIGDQGSANLNSASHYDNCAWGEGRNWILTHRQAAVDAAYRYYQNGRAEDRQAAIENLGYVFHTTEDFYAHSNWIENNNAGAIANLEGDKPSYWISGTWLLDSPKLCPIGTPDHLILNKDTPDRPGFKEAFTDAVLATQKQFEQFKSAVRVAYPNQANAIIFKLLYSGRPLSYTGFFEYKFGDGTIGFDRVYSDPAYGSVETGRNKWKGDWTNIESFTLNSTLYLVEYKNSDGTIAFDRLRKDGADSSEVWRGKWSTGWTVIKPFTLNDVTYLVEYKKGDGTIAIDRINSNAQGSTEVWRGKWSSGWTTIEPFVLNNVTYLVEYKSGDGTIAIDRINSNAQGSTEVWRGRWSTGWTFIKPLAQLDKFEFETQQ